MKFKTTLILLGVFIVLLAAVLFFEQKGKKSQAKKEKEEKLVDLVAADVERVTLKKEDGTVSFKRDEKGDWQITEPLEARAESSEVSGLVDNFTGLKIERVVEASPRDLSKYEIPKKEITLWVKGNEKPVKVLIGMENPIDSSLFAKREDDERVVLIAGFLKATLDKKVFDFRQKDVFKFETSDVKGIRLRAKDVQWEALKKEEDWFLKSPVESLAAKSKIDSILSSLAGLKAKEFVSEQQTEEDTKKVGLDKAEYEVVLSMPLVNKDSKFGFHKVDDKVYAANSLSNKIILVESQILTDLEKKADELREKKVAEFSSWDAGKIWIRKGGLDLTAAKEKVKEEDKWFLSSPAKPDADGSKVETLIRKLEGMEAAEFVDSPQNPADFGLDSPLAEVKIWTKEGEDKTKETHILFGKVDSEKKQVVVKNAKYAYLFKVDSAVLDEFPKEAKDWQPAPPAQESTSDKKK